MQNKTALWPNDPAHSASSELLCCFNRGKYWFEKPPHSSQTLPSKFSTRQPKGKIRPELCTAAPLCARWAYLGQRHCGGKSFCLSRLLPVLRNAKLEDPAQAARRSHSDSTFRNGGRRLINGGRCYCLGSEKNKLLRWLLEAEPSPVCKCRGRYAIVVGKKKRVVTM